ncbi:3-oxoadipyl-CoA thiolase [Zavarzinia compransoris]|uniref:acetyl-CoA C-acyltransferase n=1 Tax=Zavarzinia compransoris TaxID=1264899 RepID=A0A317E4A8_9PROT|nr:3-oxoadipyl-CoA thiolase [Zavarzinia compransoris]PWR20986.1 3-oxoadipyl-CoA thiolase [Zavarzinia compransoris]TDP44017.1 acetyl-CoA C-acetyltransferase [Zavarzinia compransoris]
MTDAFLYDGIRTPFGRHAGGLAPVRPDDLLAGAIAALVGKTGVPGEAIEEVIVGCANQAGEDCRNVGRHALLLAGLPDRVAGQTVNRLCGSGLAAVIDAARAVKTGEGDLLIAGGVESMTRAPFVIPKSESAFGRDARIYDTTIGSRFPNRKFTAAFGDDSMPETAENVAADLGLSREAGDGFAARSQANYARALAEGFYEGEIIPVSLPGPKGTVKTVAADEHPRPQSDAAALSGLKPLRAGGVVTAGNASGINDGAAALLIGSAAAGERLGKAPMARLVSAAVAGVAPRIMGVGPAYAIPKALDRAGLTLADMDLIEINEAFAVQVLGCLKLLDLGFDDARVNPNGGAIAIGHPLGASGARLALTAARQLQRSQGRYAVVSLCIGVGQGIALVIERL